jgi:serine/threonine protein kinase
MLRASKPRMKREQGTFRHGPGDFIAGRYLLGERLGIGGMGIVYRAEQACLLRSVAVKLLRPELETNPHALRRFHDEALAGSRLHHRNVVSVIDFGETVAGAPFLVMEHLRGEPLGELIHRAGAMPLRRAANLVGQILAALADAHHAGIVHADVKSDNILVDTNHDGSELAKLIDFGLARLADHPRPVIGGDMLVSGTPDYIAPEVVRGGIPTPLSDLYGIGIVLYEAVTGATPFGGGGSTKIMARHLVEAVVPPALRCPERGIPVQFERVIMRALEKDPKARFPSAEAFAQALELATPAIEPADAPAFRPVAHERFSTRGPTRDWFAEPPPSLVLPPRRDAAAAHHDSEEVRLARAKVGAAIARGDVDRVAVSYLELAHELVNNHRLVSALVELQEAIDVITRGAGAGMENAPTSLWRILLTAAAITDGLGDPVGARVNALAALDHASKVDSKVGRDRARALLERIAA